MFFIIELNWKAHWSIYINKYIYNKNEFETNNITLFDYNS